VIEPLQATKSGSIVNISSVSAMRAIPGQFAYAASKWAVRGMTGNAAFELARLGIRVNAVYPGLINTPMIAGNSEETNVKAQKNDDRDARGLQKPRGRRCALAVPMLVGLVLKADAAERERLGDRVERALGDRNADHAGRGSRISRRGAKPGHGLMLSSLPRCPRRQ
jgi:NAD(P)-dependent dehydrogenase (short-subunit alcohol dehydrogenase family)